MSTTTTNYGLVKPELTDAADITATNENWDKIDAELKSTNTLATNAAPKSTHNLKTYTALEQLNITPGSETIESIVSAMPNHSLLHCAVSSSNNMSIYPSEYGGTLIVEKSFGNRAKFTYFAQTHEWIGHYFNSVWNGWQLSFDELNPPTATQVGALPANGTATNSNKVNGDVLTGSTSILDYALTLGVGTYEFSINGASYTGGDLPNSNYSYGRATIHKRADNAITVIVWGFNASSALVPMFNQYGNNIWSGWQKLALTTDLSLDKLGAAPSTYIDGHYSITSDEQFNEVLDSVLATMEVRTRKIITTSHSSTSPLRGGIYTLTIDYQYANYAIITAVSYQQYGRVASKVKYNGTWGDWVWILDGLKVPIAAGGLGRDFTTMPKGAVLRNATDNSGFWYTETANGAMYATSSEGAPKFGTLPIAQGGTGATNADTARGNLGIVQHQDCSGADFNTIKAEGTYYGYTGMTNAKFNSISVLEVIQYSPDWIVQRQTSLNGNREVWQRYYHSGNTWTDWEQIYTSSQMAWKKVSVSFNSGSGSTSASGVKTTSTVLATRGDSAMSGGGYTTLAADCNSNGTIKMGASTTNSGTYVVNLWWTK